VPIVATLPHNWGYSSTHLHHFVSTTYTFGLAYYFSRFLKNVFLYLLLLDIGDFFQKGIGNFHFLIWMPLDEFSILLQSERRFGTAGTSRIRSTLGTVNNVETRKFKFRVSHTSQLSAFFMEKTFFVVVGAGQESVYTIRVGTVRHSSYSKEHSNFCCFVAHYVSVCKYVWGAISICDEKH
jgi:hypothetical protein